MLREIPRTRDTASACCCRTRDQLHVGGLTAIILRLEREGAALSRLFSFLRGEEQGILGSESVPRADASAVVVDRPALHAAGDGDELPADMA